MENIIEKINNTIKCKIEEYNKIINKRKNNVSIFNVLEYAFLYSDINNTKEQCKAETNINNNVNHSRSSYERNLKRINIDFFINFYDTIKKLYYDEIHKFKHITDILNDNYIIDKFNSQLSNNYSVYGIDGICGNVIQNNILNTNLDVYGFDLINELPVTIMDNLNIKMFGNNKNNESNKNHETTILNNFVKNNNDIKNTIFIGDRIYSTYTIIDTLETKKLNYIIRLKDNLDIVNKSCIDADKIKNKTKSNVFNNDKIRIIEYYVHSTEILKNKTKEIKLKIKQKYYLITNLCKDEYPDELIQHLYRFRWKIEVYFKCLKNNFKFDTFYLKDNDEILKLKYIEMTIYILNKLCSLYCLEYFKDKDKLDNIKEKKSFSVYNKDLRFTENKKKRDEFIKDKFVKCSVKINSSLSLKGFYKILLQKIINGKLDYNTLEKYSRNYIKIDKNETNRVFKRSSISPFSKWYIKKYHKIYELKKIINAIINDKIEDLNKNLKLKAKDLIENIKDKTTFPKLKEFLNIS